jgi:hypothetical protein
MLKKEAGYLAYPKPITGSEIQIEVSKFLAIFLSELPEAPHTSFWAFG